MSQPFPAEDVLPSSVDLAFGRHMLDQQHGPFLISSYLDVLGLGNWTSRVLGFLRIYDGLETWLEPGDAEAVEFVRQLLLTETQKASDSTVKPEDLAHLRFRLAVAMANAPFTSYGAAFKIQRRPGEAVQSIWWNPLQQSWLAFLSRREELPDHTRLYVSGPCDYRAPAQGLIAYLMER